MQLICKRSVSFKSYKVIKVLCKLPLSAMLAFLQPAAPLLAITSKRVCLHRDNGVKLSVTRKLLHSTTRMES